MRRLLVWAFLSISFSVSAASYQQDKSYCTAIRGNGELMPAHWGAMSRLVEKYGMPSAMAGGSSASITMFLMESIALNNLATNDEQKSLLIKSIEGYVEILSTTDEGKALIKVLSDKESVATIKKLIVEAKSTGEIDTSSPEAIKALSKHLSSIQIILTASDFKEILNPELLSYVAITKELAEELKINPSLELGEKVEFRYGQINEVINNFGKFSTESDNNLFFRPGLISFSKIASLFGRMANFYALYDMGKENENVKLSKIHMKSFLNSCAEKTIGRSWQELIKERPYCRNLLGQAMLTYRNEFIKRERSGNVIKQRINDLIGLKISSFPTTSVIINNKKSKANVVSGKEIFDKALIEYNKSTNPNVGRDFKIHHSQYRFGYWGKSDELSRISDNLKNKDGFYDSNNIKRNFSKDKKSSKFYSLGEATWFSALTTSPAEPGLARILNIKKVVNGKLVNREDVLSAGGWNDLHPTLLLNALGCKNTIYVTRRGGDSMFGQGVAKKLTKMGGFNWSEWNSLNSDEKRIKNATGNPNDLKSSWSKLYNLANPNSSFSKSLKVASAVLCTNWDAQNIKNGVPSIVSDGYNAPFYNRSTNSFLRDGKNSLNIPNPSPRLLFSDGDSTIKYSGCIPKE